MWIDDLFATSSVGGRESYFVRKEGIVQKFEVLLMSRREPLVSEWLKNFYCAIEYEHFEDIVNRGWHEESVRFELVDHAKSYVSEQTVGEFVLFKSDNSLYSWFQNEIEL